MYVSFVQVDLFFYREPEETKQAEEEEAAPAIDYANVAPEYSMNLGSDQWPSQIADAQWPGEVPKPIAAVPGGVTYFPEGWTFSFCYAASKILLNSYPLKLIVFFLFAVPVAGGGDGWDAAPAPQMATIPVPDVATPQPTGWD